jgi:chromosome segregation ATPase
MKIINTLSTIFIILAVAACAQTTATKSTSQEREETRQTSPPSSKTSSETTESAQQESHTESESGAEAAAEAAAGQKAEAARLPTAAESELQKSERESGTRQSTAKDSADAKLAQAQENLRISQETEKRIAAELEQLKASGSASEEAVRDYETYLKSVKAMTAENRKIVEQMEAAYVQKSSDEIGSGQPSKNELGNIGDPDIPEEQTMDEVTALDRQLNASLAKFDGLLLKEMDEIRAGSSKKIAGSCRGGG